MTKTTPKASEGSPIGQTPAGGKGSSEAKGTGPEANKPNNPTAEKNKIAGK